MNELGGALFAIVVSYEYSYDGDSNVATRTVTLPGNALNGEHEYGYDRAGRLTSWTKPDLSLVGCVAVAGPTAKDADARGQQLAKIGRALGPVGWCWLGQCFPSLWGQRALLLLEFCCRRSRGAIRCSPGLGAVLDNALAETVNLLYKAELIYGPDQGPWHTVGDVELATLGWVYWYNN